MKLVILDEFGKNLSEVYNITIAPSVGMCVTTMDGTYQLNEVAIDYRKNQVIAYTREGLYDQY